MATCAVGRWPSPRLGYNIRGTAPNAQLFSQTIFELNGTATKQSFQTLVDHADEIGAKVHSNSYTPALLKASDGKFHQPNYSLESTSVDMAAWKYRNVTILFAAGNDGEVTTVEGGQIGDYAAAKNSITVGACETSHPITFDKDREPQIKYDINGLWGETNRLATFSNIGPTRNTVASGVSNSRIKPDVVAPGTTIYSAKSTDPNVVFPKGATVNNFSYFGSPPDNDPPDDLYFFRSGTSMATPVVAGCCAVIRNALRSSLHRLATETAISSDMVKAVLINGTTDMTTSPVPQRTDRAIGRAPSGQQGFGVVNLAKSLLCVLSGGNGGVYPMISFVRGSTRAPALRYPSQSCLRLPRRARPWVRWYQNSPLPCATRTTSVAISTGRW